MLTFSLDKFPPFARKQQNLSGCSAPRETVGLVHRLLTLGEVKAVRGEARKEILLRRPYVKSDCEITDRVSLMWSDLDDSGAHSQI